ncbi:hypothetical protein BP5796_01365 [Coleophoma crateriformis]|uniref:Uncharacterized protein n=1 Tax=Coleophoma crateriformis TaxID=565419 RepID=A0A3D8T0L8_9HELO|nr:hypothetical protein BP5796_01365 [Coleophoma crateriformis]
MDEGPAQVEASELIAFSHSPLAAASAAVCLRLCSSVQCLEPADDHRKNCQMAHGCAEPHGWNLETEQDQQQGEANDLAGARSLRTLGFRGSQGGCDLLKTPPAVHNFDLPRKPIPIQAQPRKPPTTNGAVPARMSSQIANTEMELNILAPTNACEIVSAVNS